ncbi:hypothetical protein V6N12_012659 [Hibiscus sabdariffa]|uniref:Uncharacterized protein n=1 Tax=Hibiscus sabdariffa TaxID=183260 RepID=A0ABR2DEV8_9ROSI
MNAIRVLVQNAKGHSWAETVAKGLNRANETPNQTQTIKDMNQAGEGKDILYSRAVEDTCNMVLRVANPDKDLWAKVNEG